MLSSDLNVKNLYSIMCRPVLAGGAVDTKCISLLQRVLVYACA